MTRPPTISEESFDLIVHGVMLYCPAMEGPDLGRLIGFFLKVLEQELTIARVAHLAEARDLIEEGALWNWQALHAWLRQQSCHPG
ncbi:MAG: hypothetical protein L0Z62_16530 [Gemmataceae bacterium]|nr:hypothetical protein [Gemmataceae bacterium]